MATRSYHQKARAESAESTGKRIVEAFLTRLMQQWFDEITLDSVAEDAAVTVQTVVRRFGGKEGLLKSAVDMLAPQITSRRAAPTGRLDELVRNLVGDYEETGDAVIRLLALEHRHPSLKRVLDFGRSEHRRWVLGAFEQVLSKLDGSERQQATDGLVIATDVYTWKLLRRDLGRSVLLTIQTMKDLIQGTVTQYSNKKKGLH